MRESGYYPTGAEHDPNAPYNHPGSVRMELVADYTLTRRAECDVDGDVDETAWRSRNMTPLELLAECKALAEAVLAVSGDNEMVARHLRHVIAQCDGWEVYESNFEIM